MLDKMEAPQDPAFVALSTQVYRALLFAYPAGFRQTYGPHMAQVFQDCCRRESRENGLVGLCSLWIHTLMDFAVTVAEQHTQQEADVSKTEFIRWSGWGMAIGGLLFTIGYWIGAQEEYYFDPLGGPEALIEFSALIGIGTGMLLFTIGLIGLALRYRDGVSRLGRSSLWLAAAASLVSFVSGIGMDVFNLPLWTIWMYAFLTLFTFLSVFGFEALRSRPLPHWNALPLGFAVWFPLLFVAVHLYQALTGTEPSLGETVVGALFTLAGMGFLLLGLLLQKDASEEPLLA